jgi:acetamidase/formamidase
VIACNAFSQSIDFTPATYYNTFSHHHPVALKINAGDTINSESVDAGGFDKSSNQIAKSGNPVTGPFFVEGAKAGDIIAITLTHVSLTRDHASTVQSFLERCLPKDVIREVFGRNATRVTWRFNSDKTIASPEPPYQNMPDFSVRLHPFLGCVGVAAAVEDKEPLTYSADRFGGNMDFRRVTKDATIYLPVFHDGALLYFGDGHAAQGDGELNGDALETSMAFGFVTKVIKGKERLDFPRIEDSEYIIAMGMDKSMEEALKHATLNLLTWVREDYGLTLKEATQVIGPLIEYRIPTIASPKFEIAAMIKKENLKTLPRVQTSN